VPTLQTPTGGVWESNAIARYVARLADKGLFGASQYEEARSPERSRVRCGSPFFTRGRTRLSGLARLGRQPACCARPALSACVRVRVSAGCSPGCLRLSGLGCARGFVGLSTARGHVEAVQHSAAPGMQAPLL